MSDQVLTEWVRTASAEEKYDVLMQLMVLAMSNESVGEDPSCLLVGEDCKVSVMGSAGSPNLAWQAPEVISVVTDDPIHAAGPAQRLFTVGLLAYWALSGKDYYATRGIDAATLSDFVARRTSVIRPSDVSSIPCGDALVKWTSVNPSKRVEGNALFLGYLQEHVPCTVVISYVSRGSELSRDTRTATDVTRLKTGDTVDIHGARYRVSRDYSFPYRPGEHHYKVEVTRVKNVAVGKKIYIPKSFITGNQADLSTLSFFLDLSGESATKSITLKMSYPEFVYYIVGVNADGSTSNLGHAGVPKPQGFGGVEYVLTLLFDKPNGMLYARLDDTSGHLLGARNLGSI